MSTAPRPRRAYLVGGWTNGPLAVLEADAAAAGVECHYVPVPTPPFGWRWLCTPWVPAAIAAFAVGHAVADAAVTYFISRLRAPGEPPHALAVTIVTFTLAVAVAWLPVRWCVYQTVRAAVRRGVDALKFAIDCATASDADAESAVLVGFSWGGAVVSELLAGGDHVRSALLLAPTVFAVAAFAGRNPRSFQPQQHGVTVVAVHPLYDPFCSAAQRAWLEATGCDVVAVPDDHVLSRSAPRIRTALFSLLA